MRRTAASLAAALLLTWALLAGGCGSGGAEPDAPDGRAVAPISLVLDFQPNAVHAGIYVAVANGAAIDVREPGSSTDAPKLLEAGRVDAAVMDINDLGIAREKGADLVGVGAIVQVPLAAVIAADGASVRTPADLAGGIVGVTGLPSDDAVLDTVLATGGVAAGEVERQTIGFDSVPLLSAGRVDAATAFWNAEGVALKEAGVPTREFRVDDFGAPRYPELVLVTTGERLAEDRDSIEGLVAALKDGYAGVVADPDAGLAALVEAVPGLEEGPQRAQLEALLEAGAFRPPLTLDPAAVGRWAEWAAREGILSRPIAVDEAFELSR
jgi:NitT/TauT family transport system substrate-binding protein/putative hydroxymethylpyrimidine transport system substrate-binding protein